MTLLTIRSRRWSESVATSPATLLKQRENHSHKSDETVGQTTTSRGRSHPPLLHQSARTGHLASACKHQQKGPPKSLATVNNPDEGKTLWKRETLKVCYIS